MKKLLSVIILLSLCVTAFCSCSSNKTETYEDKLIGKWSATTSGVTIMYFFEENEEGEYEATYIIETGENTKSITTYSYSATDKTISFTQSGHERVLEYHFEDQSLYIDGLKYSKYVPEGEEAEDGSGFTPSNFVKNLSYMGSGMLGIFVVIGIIVSITYILNGVSKKKN